MLSDSKKAINWRIPSSKMSTLGEVEKEVAGEVKVVCMPKWRRWSDACIQWLMAEGRGFILPLSILLAGVLLQRLAALTPWLTERFYGRVIYTRLIMTLSWFSRGLSFSLGEALASITLLGVFTCVILFCLRLRQGRGGRRRLVTAWLRRGAWVAAALLWSFLFTFGLNYQRPLLFEKLGYEQRRVDASELEALGRLIVGSINQTHAEAHAGGRPSPGREEVVNLLNESYETVPDLKQLSRGDFAPPKPLFASEVLTRLGVSGIYFPYTGEPNYNADVPDFLLPFVMAHEMAHQRGVARESEANFVAYVVCINSRDPFLRYSGYRNGLGVLSELYKVEPEKARELSRQLGPGYREDSRRAALFWVKAAGTAGALSQRLNDFYLRANRVKAGVADYGNSTTLIIAYHLRQTSNDGGAISR